MNGSVNVKRKLRFLFLHRRPELHISSCLTLPFPSSCRAHTCPYCRRSRYAPTSPLGLHKQTLSQTAPPTSVHQSPFISILFVNMQLGTTHHVPAVSVKMFVPPGFCASNLSSEEVLSLHDGSRPVLSVVRSARSQSRVFCAARLFILYVVRLYCVAPLSSQGGNKRNVLLLCS